MADRSQEEDKILTEATKQFEEFCFETLIRHQEYPNDGRLYCNASFHHFGCWNLTLAGTTAVIPCPEPLVAIFGNFGGFASRHCEEDGVWKELGSNLSQCLTRHVEDASSHNRIYFFIGGYSLSIVALVISLIIFFVFRQLRCERIAIHKNLFVSYVMTGVAWILYYSLATLDGVVLLYNPVWCQVLHVIGQYATVCNFSWMFCEGLYLHTVMVQAFHTGKALYIICLFIGWGVPAILTAIYTGIRASLPERTLQCWTYEDNLLWIMLGPVVISFVINIGILINIIRLLLTKLRQVPEASQGVKAARATLILVPLLGLQFLIMPIKPQEGSPLHDVYHWFIAICSSLQGFMVSVMYCFCNGEVMSIVRRKWQQHRLMTSDMRKNTALSTTYTEAYSVVHNSSKDLTSQKPKVLPDSYNRNADSVELKPLKFNPEPIHG